MNILDTIQRKVHIMVNFLNQNVGIVVVIGKGFPGNYMESELCQQYCDNKEQHHKNDILTKFLSLSPLYQHPCNFFSQKKMPSVLHFHNTSMIFLPFVRLEITT